MPWGSSSGRCLPVLMRADSDTFTASKIHGKSVGLLALGSSRRRWPDSAPRRPWAAVAELVGKEAHRRLTGERMTGVRAVGGRGGGGGVAGGAPPPRLSRVPARPCRVAQLTSSCLVKALLRQSPPPSPGRFPTRPRTRPGEFERGLAPRGSPPRRRRRKCLAAPPPSSPKLIDRSRRAHMGVAERVRGMAGAGVGGRVGNPTPGKTGKAAFPRRLRCLPGRNRHRHRGRSRSGGGSSSSSSWCCCCHRLRCGAASVSAVAAYGAGQTSNSRSGCVALTATPVGAGIGRRPPPSASGAAPAISAPAQPGAAPSHCCRRKLGSAPAAPALPYFSSLGK